MASRAKAAREMRRTQQFAKFRMVELNLVPLVDTFVSIVFFALTTQTMGELAPMVPGVSLPSSSVGKTTGHEITLGIASKPAEVTLGGQRIMTVQAAAAAASNIPNEPLIIPQLYSALRRSSDGAQGWLQECLASGHEDWWRGRYRHTKGDVIWLPQLVRQARQVSH